MRSDMTTRHATESDLPRMAELLAELRGEEPDLQAVRSQFENQFVGKDRTVVLVLDDSSKPVGMAALNLVYKLPKVECRLDEVVVSSAVRSQGYGSELIVACEAWAWENGADMMDFTSRPSREAANALYQKLGFELRGTNVYTKKRGN